MEAAAIIIRSMLITMGAATIEVRDAATGRPVPCRMLIQTDNGSSLLPVSIRASYTADAPHLVKALANPQFSELWFAATTGNATVTADAGASLRVRVERGHEWTRLDTRVRTSPVGAPSTRSSPRSVR